MIRESIHLDKSKRKRERKLSTWEVLNEVDRLMSHVDGWKTHPWEEIAAKGRAAMFAPTNEQLRFYADRKRKREAHRKALCTSTKSEALS